MQLKVPSNEQRESIARLNLSKDGKMFSSYIDEALAVANEKVAMSDDPARTRLIQGEQRVLLELQKLLNPVS